MPDLVIDLPYAYYMVTLNSHGFVIEAPPIARWMIGRHESYILRWVKTKGGKIIKAKEEPNA